MKALSIKQPYASAIADGTKTREYRTWQIAYRGPLAIVASKSPVVDTLPTGASCAWSIWSRSKAAPGNTRGW